MRQPDNAPTAIRVAGPAFAARGLALGVTFLLVALAAATLFGCAGGTGIPRFWAYLSVWMVAGIWSSLTLDLDLQRERLRPGEGQQDRLQRIRLIAAPVFASYWIVPGLDVRRHWTEPLAAALWAPGLAGFALSLALIIWARNTNRFFSSAVRIQCDRGHHVITTGPYAAVRHPGYLGFIAVGFFSGLALGSWLALGPPFIFLILFGRRAAMEDRFLREHLPGYSDYARRVRYRLIPGIW